jgi:hypothetical protein
VVLVIWMIILLIHDRVSRMIDSLLTHFENKVKLPPIKWWERNRMIHWDASWWYNGGLIQLDNAGLMTLGPITSVQLHLCTPAKDVQLLHTLRDDNVCAMNEGAAELASYW